MIRIGAQLNGLERTLLNNLNKANTAAAQNALRLSTGKNVNYPSDDPAAFFALSGFETRLKVVNSTLVQVDKASSIAAESQLALDLIRTQIDVIRSTLLEDEDLSLTPTERSDKQLAIDSALQEIDRLSGTEVNGRRILDGSSDFRVSGQLTGQVRSVDVYSLGAPTSLTSAKPAELTYTGSNRAISADANITLTGAFGSATIELTQDQSLQSAAAEINARTSITGIRATASDNELSLESIFNGDAASIAVAVNSGAFGVTGGNGDGTAQGSDGLLASQPSIAGTVLEAATQGSLTYAGAGGLITADASFTLTGATGAASISVTNGETLSEVADRINAQSHATGVLADVDGDDLNLTSINYGTSATVAVVVDSGAFGVTGGNGDGTAQGTNAVAEINGKVISGNQAATAAAITHTELSGQLQGDVDFTLTGDLGSFAFSFNNGDALATLASAINLQSGVTGIAASVSTDGFDLVLESVAQGAGATIDLEVTDGEFDLTVDEEATATSYVAAQQAELIYEGADGRATDAASFDLTGLDGTTSASIVIAAGDTLSSVAQKVNQETLNTGVAARAVGDQLVIYSVEFGTDAFVDLDINSGTFDTTGGDVDLIATGVDQQITVAGQNEVTNLYAVDGNRFYVNDNGNSFTIEFTGGFSGDFQTIRLSDAPTLKFNLSTAIGDITTLALPAATTSRLGGFSGVLADLRTGGLFAGLGGNTSAAIRVVDEALAELTLIEGRVDAFADGAVASSSALLTGLKSTLEDSIDSINEVNEDEESLLLEKNRQLADSVLASLAILSDQRSKIVQLIERMAGLS
ncbi:flagellin hook IN motif-containing protein [Blastopirellula retiformator]|uniref:Flagellin n=1 Tax=Blastopirellula retiformator TaxID=2527970 RepID=A0A5C5VJD9_9BACT|nr:flagellin hook IN motif-containing protein [Blastopirellula retiformator]TWT38726.1 flagellin [Blastopirellula retiformator]